MAGNKEQKTWWWEWYHMAVWATSNREGSLNAEVLFDMTYKVEWRSDLDSVRCVKQTYNLVLDVNRAECQGYLLTMTEWQKVKCSARGWWARITMKVKKTVKHYKTHKSLVNGDNVAQFKFQVFNIKGRKTSEKQCDGRQAQMFILWRSYK